jgi:hypothetical protein
MLYKKIINPAIEVLKSTSIASLVADLKLLRSISVELNKIQEIAKSSIEAEAKMILPDNFSDYQSLLNKRQEIQQLLWLPVKTNEDRAEYHKIPKQVLIDNVNSLLSNANVKISKNTYPYFLPPSVGQYIVWVSDNSSKSEIISQIFSFLKLCKIKNVTDVIIFERPRKSDRLLVKGTLPEIRHLHLWIKK